MTKVKYVGPDGIQTQAFIDGAGADVAEGAYASVAGVALDKLPPTGLKFVKDYEAKYRQSDRTLRCIWLRDHECCPQGNRRCLRRWWRPHRPRRRQQCRLRDQEL